MKKVPWRIGYRTLLWESIKRGKRLPTQIPLKRYVRGCWKLAFLDDIVCRQELRDMKIKGRPVSFPPKKESILFRYRLFLEMYAEDTPAQWRKVYKQTEKRAKALSMK